MKNHNHIEVDLQKVAYLDYYWTERTESYRRQEKPRKPTVRGKAVDKKEMAAPHLEYPGETLYERAVRLDLLDNWFPVCRLQLTNSHSLVYTGKKAITIHNTWRNKVYGKH